MVQIHVQKNQGLTHAIKAELQRQNYDTSKMNGSIWTNIMNEVSVQNTQNIQQGKDAIFTGGTDLNGSGHKNFVVQEGIIELAQNLWNKIVSLVTGKPAQDTQTVVSNNSTQQVEQTTATASTADVNKIAQVPETPKTNKVEPPADLKRNVEAAQTFLLNQLPNLSTSDLQQMGISSEKRDRLMEYLKNITYDTDHDSAQAKGAGIVFSIHCEDSDKLANMVTLLMHEANHCDENYLSQFPADSNPDDLRHRDSNGNPRNAGVQLVNTKEEERACETLGLLTTAVLIKNGTLKGFDDYGRYGNTNGKFNPVTSYLTDKTLLNTDIENWVSAYTNYPEGINNAGVTIQHLHNEKCPLSDDLLAKSMQLKPGDIIKVGDTEYTLGGDNGIVFSPWDSLPMFQMIPQGDLKNGTAGLLVFNGFEPTKEEQQFFNSQHNNDGEIYTTLNSKDYQAFTVIRNNEVIASGKKY